MGIEDLILYSKGLPLSLIFFMWWYDYKNWFKIIVSTIFYPFIMTFILLIGNLFR